MNALIRRISWADITLCSLYINEKTVRAGVAAFDQKSTSVVLCLCVSTRGENANVCL